MCGVRRNTFVYYTIGTGVGGGGMFAGRLMHSLTHLEMGHIFLPHDRARDPYPGLSRRLLRGPGERADDRQALGG